MISIKIKINLISIGLGYYFQPYFNAGNNLNNKECINPTLHFTIVFTVKSNKSININHLNESKLNNIFEI